MDTSESKVACQVWVFLNNHMADKVGPFDGLFHLFEHTYNERHTFWYGVIDAVNLDYFDHFVDPVPGARIGPFGVVEQRDRRVIFGFSSNCPTVAWEKPTSSGGRSRRGFKARAPCSEWSA